jgi:hypothetical protein
MNLTTAFAPGNAVFFALNHAPAQGHVVKVTTISDGQGSRALYTVKHGPEAFDRTDLPEDRLHPTAQALAAAMRRDLDEKLAALLVAVGE